LTTGLDSSASAK